MNILIADDSKMIRYMLLEVLHELGYNDITEASNVSEAKTLLKGKKYSLIISDFHMPGETGLDFLKYIRATPEYAKLPFVLLTTDNEKQNIVAAVQSGVQAYLFKPVQKPALEQKLTELAKTYGFQSPAKTASKSAQPSESISAKKLSEAVSAPSRQEFGILFKTTASENGSLQVCIGNGNMAHFSAFMQKSFAQARTALILDAATQAQYKEVIAKWEKDLSCVCIVLPEESTGNTISQYATIIESLAAQKFDCTSVIIGFGSATAIHTAGFAAATFVGGIRFVIVPTSLAAFLSCTVSSPWALSAQAVNNIAKASRAPSLAWFDIAPHIALAEKEYLYSCADFFRYLFIGGEEIIEVFKKLWDKIISKDPESIIEFCRLCIAVRASICGTVEDTSQRETVLAFAQPIAGALSKCQPGITTIPGQELYRAIICMFDAAKRANALSPAALPVFAEILKKLPALEPTKGVDGADVFMHAFDVPRRLTGVRSVAFPNAAGSVIIKSEIPEPIFLETFKTLCL